MPTYQILGVHITDRLKDVPAVQAVFTEYGCNIKTRLGLHNVSGDYCASNGLVLIEFYGEPAKCVEMAEKLAAVEGVVVETMVFD